MGAKSRLPSGSLAWRDRQTYPGLDLVTSCATQTPTTGNGTEEPRQEHECVLNEDCHGSQGAAVTWTALTVRCGESQWHFPHKPPNGEEPTMRKSSYSEELVKHQARFASDLAGSCGEAGARTPIMCQNSLVQPAPVRTSPQVCQPDWSSLLPADRKMVLPF